MHDIPTAQRSPQEAMFDRDLGIIRDDVYEIIAKKLKTRITLMKQRREQTKESAPPIVKKGAEGK